MTLFYECPVTQLWQGDALDVLREMETASVHCVVTSPIVVYSLLWYAPFMPDAKGRFLRGEHWREPKPYWDRDWLYRRYAVEGASAQEIALEQGCGENNILYWLHKHGIQPRTTSETRKVKYWGVSGTTNPMFGVRDSNNPRWKGGKGSRPQGRVEYRAWREGVIAVYGHRCLVCGKTPIVGRDLQAHHLKSWKEYPNLRYDVSNGITVCSSCHPRLHSQRRVNGRFAREGGGH